VRDERVGRADLTSNKFLKISPKKGRVVKCKKII
jgi:hypothetical protein